MKAVTCRRQRDGEYYMPSNSSLKVNIIGRDSSLKVMASPSKRGVK